MAFSAVTGKSVWLSDGQVQSIVTVTNDATGATFEDALSYQPGSDLASTKTNLEVRVRARIEQATREVTAKQVPLLPPGTALTVSVADVVFVPTKEQAERIAWFTRRQARVQQAKYDALPDDEKADFRPEYMDAL